MYYKINKMRKIFLSLFVLFSLTSFSFAQEAELLVDSKGKSALIESKTTGEFEFKFETKKSKESIEKASSFYTQHFTVDYNEETGIVKINMINNTPESRIIVSRFLSYSQVRFVKVDNENLNMTDFIEMYLR